MRPIDRLVINAYVVPVALMALGLAVILASWALGSTLPTSLRLLARWMPLLLIASGFAWGIATTCRLWRREHDPRHPVAGTGDPAPPAQAR